jgi:16S rRNA (cytidine1402-2'-O)-methyltransferase
VHEEVWRGTLDDAADRVSAVEPRGEYVVVVEAGVDDGEPADDDGIRDALQDAFARGDDRKAAIATVAGALRVPKRRVYEIATSLPRPGSTSGDPTATKTTNGRDQTDVTGNGRA